MNHPVHLCTTFKEPEIANSEPPRQGRPVPRPLHRPLSRRRLPLAFRRPLRRPEPESLPRCAKPMINIEGAEGRFGDYLWVVFIRKFI